MQDNLQREYLVPLKYSNFSFVSFCQRQQLKKDVLNLSIQEGESITQEGGVFFVAKDIDTSKVQIDKDFYNLVNTLRTPKA